MLSGYEAKPFEQSVCIGIASDEVSIQQGRIFAVALFQDLTAVISSGGSIKYSFSVKASESIGVQHLRPFVRVVTGPICYRACEKMRETCDDTVRVRQRYGGVALQNSTRKLHHVLASLRIELPVQAQIDETET